jgi:hypothetical protein
VATLFLRMEVLRIFILLFLFLDTGLLLLGLWRPVVVLWWLDYQNRRRVLHYYGWAWLVLLVLWLVV